MIILLLLFFFSSEWFLHYFAENCRHRQCVFVLYVEKRDISSLEDYFYLRSCCIVFYMEKFKLLSLSFSCFFVVVVVASASVLLSCLHYYYYFALLIVILRCLQNIFLNAYYCFRSSLLSKLKIALNTKPRKLRMKQTTTKSKL